MARHLQLGAAGEDAVARWYADQGAEVLDRNWRGAAGEIDVICRFDAGGRPPLIVVCEVKTRTGSRHGTGAEAVDWRKRQRLRRAAAQWLSEHPSTGRRDVRFDVASVDWDGRGLRLDVIERAF